MTIHLIHGIHDGGRSPVENLIPYLTGYTVRYPDYGYILGLETKLVSPIIVGALLPYIEPDDILIGHSNGCAIAYELLRRGAPATRAVFINAALDSSVPRPGDTVRWIDVYSNKGDEVTEAAKIGAELGITDPVWGEMGHAGYTGTDPIFSNIYCDTNRNMPVVVGHDNFFMSGPLPAWGPFLHARLAR